MCTVLFLTFFRRKAGFCPAPKVHLSLESIEVTFLNIQESLNFPFLRISPITPLSVNGAKSSVSGINMKSAQKYRTVRREKPIFLPFITKCL